MPTTAADVVELLDLLDEMGAQPVVAGGWGVDALAGRSTRDHRDLDVLVRADRLDDAIAGCRRLGYERGVDWLPIRIELDDSMSDRHIDLHPAHDDGEGGWWHRGFGDDRFEHRALHLTIGTIGDRRVRCLTIARQLQLRSGYDPRPEDRHDVAVLRRLDSREHDTRSSDAVTPGDAQGV